MIDLKKLQALFDEFFKTETIESFNEWLKSKSEVEEAPPPPGILKMSRNDSYTTAHKMNYAHWYKESIQNGYVPSSISVEGVTWEVGEEVGEEVRNKYNGPYVIEVFKYDFGQWYAYYKNGRGCDRISSLLKLPSERKIVGWKLIKEIPFNYGGWRVGDIFKEGEQDGWFVEGKSAGIFIDDFKKWPEFFEAVYEEPQSPVVEIPKSLFKEAIQRLNYYKDVYLNHSPTIYGQVQYLVNQLNEILNPKTLTNEHRN